MAVNVLIYKDLVIWIQRMWKVRAKVIPEIIGATGTISESLRQHLSNIPGKHEIKELQKNSHIGHCAHTTKSANVKVQNVFHGRNNITCSTNCKYRTAAPLYTLDTCFFFQVYIAIDRQHECDNKDDNNMGFREVGSVWCWENWIALDQHHVKWRAWGELAVPELVTTLQRSLI